VRTKEKEEGGEEKKEKKEGGEEKKERKELQTLFMFFYYFFMRVRY